MKQKDKQKIINNLKLPDSFLKQNCCAYQVIKHESGCAIINGFYIDSTDMKDAFFCNTSLNVFLYLLLHFRLIWEIGLVRIGH